MDKYKEIKESINEELRPYYQLCVDSYRPDLKHDTPPSPPAFHPLSPFHVNEFKEIDRRKFSVEDLLTTRLEEISKELPARVLVLGRQESGKTALFAQILHYWLHDKAQMSGLKEFDFLLGIQCLSLESSRTRLDIERHMMGHLRSSVSQYGEGEVREAMAAGRVLILVDSVDFLEVESVDDTTFHSPYRAAKLVLFCGHKYMMDNPTHPLHAGQSADNLVLRLWGGLPVNQYQGAARGEDVSHEGGVLSGRVLEQYCRRLCENRKRNYKQFWDCYTDTLSHLSTEMRKPFNVYVAMEAFCRDLHFKTETPFELYSKSFDLLSAGFECQRDKTAVVSEGGAALARMAYDSFISESSACECEEMDGMDSELASFLKIFLEPHYDFDRKVRRFTFRVGGQRMYHAARQVVERISVSVGDVESELRAENFKRLELILPMVLGVARGSIYNDQIKEQALQITKHNLDDHRTKPFNDQIINYAAEVIAETRLYVGKEDCGFDVFVRKVVGCLQPNNWTVVDGNAHPKTLRTLFECGHYAKQQVPQRVNINLHGLPTDIPRMCQLVSALRNCDVRICLTHELSYRGGEEGGGEVELDQVISALHNTRTSNRTRGPSLGSLTGHLKHTDLLDKHPTTRRVYKLCLRITHTDQYAHVRRLCKNSHKLVQVSLRIPCSARLDAHKLKPLPTNVKKLTVYLEGYGDDCTKDAVAVWRGIHGSANREWSNLRFWFTDDDDEKRMTAKGAMEVVRSSLQGTRIEVSVEQPVSKYDKTELQTQLNRCASDNCVVRFLGSIQHQRFDMKNTVKKD